MVLICKLAIENEQGRKERMELLRKKIKIALELREKNLIKEHELQQLKLDIEEYTEIELVERCRYSLLDFAYCFFSKDCNPDFDDCVIPAGVSIEDAPDIHRELCNYLNEVAYSENGEKLCLSLPRSFAKSTYVSKLFPIWVQVYRLEPIAHFVVILSETVSMSNRFLDYSRNALKHCELLRNTFGCGLDPVPRLNERDNANSYVSKFANPETKRYFRCMIYSSGINSQLRGLSFYSWRPTLILGDDCESSKNTNTAELREANISFWNTVVEPLGDQTGGSSYIYIGTQIHSESLLNSLMNRPSYKTKTYSAIVKPPSEKSEHLWQKFEEIYRDRDNENREAESEEFFEQNRYTMESDVQTLWDQVPYKKLVKLKVELGTRAYMSEYLNIPPSSSGIVFEEKDFMFYDEAELPKNLEKYSFWDIAYTDKKTSDFNAVITVGRDRKTGILYILSSRIFKAKMNMALETAIEEAIKHRPRIFGIESVAAQIEMVRQFNQVLIQRGIYNVKTKPVRPQGKKTARIESLQPLIENGTLRFRKADRLLIEQFLGYPNVNDDGPDATQQCVNLVRFKRGHLGIRQF